MSVINDAQKNCVCALSITLILYFCLNTAQYIHIHTGSISPIPLPFSLPGPLALAFT